MSQIGAAEWCKINTLQEWLHIMCLQLNGWIHLSTFA